MSWRGSDLVTSQEVGQVLALVVQIRIPCSQSWDRELPGGDRRVEDVAVREILLGDVMGRLEFEVCQGLKKQPSPEHVVGLDVSCIEGNRQGLGLHTTRR